jgi:predicted phosphodiesterase
MNSDQIAAIADIHGNTWALDVVLADIRRRGIATIVNLGDCVYGSLDPAGTIERLMAGDMHTIMGNQDRDVFAPSEQMRRSADHPFVTSRLSAAQIDWLASLPPTLLLGEVFCCHGTPQSDTTYLLECVTEHGVSLADGATIQAQLAGVLQPVVLCGHSHVPRAVWLPDGRLVVNPGSVGIPAYDEDRPYPHVMEAGSPHARYAILTRTAAGWQVEHIAVPYDWDAAAMVARANGREDRARWIATGRAT